MKARSLCYSLAFVSFILATGLACSALFPSATSAPPAAPATEGPTQAPSDNGGSTGNTGAGNNSAPATFTDKNNYYAIDLPADWTHETGTETNAYWDRFEAPDHHAFIENVAYDDGTPWTGASNGRGALALLNSTYSSTGKEGDIRVTADSIQNDGSERLTWTSKGGGYSGVSFFEVRNKTTFLMFTVWWDNPYEDTYRQMLDDVIASYRTP